MNNAGNRPVTPGQVRYLNSLLRRDAHAMRDAGLELFGRDVTLEKSGPGPGDYGPNYIWTLNCRQASALINALV